jgi:hypothetical protein
MAYGRVYIVGCLLRFQFANGTFSPPSKSCVIETYQKQEDVRKHPDYVARAKLIFSIIKSDCNGIRRTDILHFAPGIKKRQKDAATGEKTRRSFVPN